MRLVVTNNPRVEEYFAVQKLDRCYQLCWVDGDTEDVLRRVRDLCHKNRRLITHPLTGSIKPNYTPYKTAVLENDFSQACDHESILLAEACLEKTLAMLVDKPRPEATRGFLADFAVIDLDFFKSYLDSVTNYPG